ncbi:MAG: hypothetical protein ACKUBY_02695 [Candidatus Moraniibacteriota bacterium]|jgi:hypothetical protein
MKKIIVLSIAIVLILISTQCHSKEKIIRGRTHIVGTRISHPTDTRKDRRDNIYFEILCVNDVQYLRVGKASRNPSGNAIVPYFKKDGSLHTCSE